MNNDVMYMVVDENSCWIYTIESDLDCAIEIARRMNDEENPVYHHYVVEECSRHYGETWLAAWKKVMD